MTSEPSTRAARRHAREGRSKWRVALIVLAIIAALLLVMVLMLFWWVQSRVVDNTERIVDAFPEETTRPQVQEDNTAINFLVLGSDSRISAGDPSQWQAGAQRTDAMMLAQFSPAENTVTIMSIPRDSWVNIPGHGQAKINAAFSYGGPPLTIQTVEELTGVRIDHFALVDFTTFQALTDQLGGVTIQTTNGPRTMDGTQALAFVRERYHLPGGDFDRVKRQQAWMRAVMSKVFTSGQLSDPLGLAQLAETAASGTAMDDGLTVATLIDYGRQARNIRPQNVTFLTAPYTGTDWSADGQSIVVLDRGRFDPLVAAWREDKLKAYLAEHAGDIPTLTQAVN